MLSADQATSRQTKHSSLDCHVGVGGYDVDMVSVDSQTIGYFLDRNSRGARQNLLQDTDMRGVQMLHQYECHSGFFRQVAQELRKGLESPRGRANADNRKRFQLARDSRLRGILSPLGLSAGVPTRGSFHATPINRHWGPGDSSGIRSLSTLVWPMLRFS